MTFKAGVMAVPQLQYAYQPGLQALRERDRNQIQCSDTRHLAGSVDLDSALEATHPNDSRWDYGIGHRSGNKEKAIWLEVHPANSSHVSEVIRKAKWLKVWLGRNTPRLFAMTREENGYIWLATGSVSLQRGSRQARQLAMAGVAFPQPRLSL